MGEGEAHDWCLVFLLSGEEGLLWGWGYVSE